MFKSTQLYSSPSNITRKFLSNNNRSTFDSDEPSDEYFNYVTMLLHGDGSNGAQNNTFIDSSSNNFTITRNGNTTQGTLSPFGDNWSNYFDGSGDWIIVPNNTATDLSTGDFTIECWINYSSFKNDAKIYLDATSVSTYWQFRYDTTNGLQIAVSGGSIILSQGSTSGWNIGTWYHVALVRSGSSFKIFRDGVTIASSTYASSLGNNTTKSIGGTPIDSPASSNAYISNFRMIKGTALYTSDFTPPTAPLTAISGTSLLTCQSSGFKDNSTNNFTLTPAGNVSVQKFSPFRSTSAYDSSTIGGSVSFDGSDYLAISTPSSDIINWYSTDYTIEYWIYANAFGSSANGYSNVLGNTATSGTAEYWSFGPRSDGVVIFYFFSGTQNAVANTGVTLKINNWYHLAFVKNSTSLKIYIDGVETASATLSVSPQSSDTVPFLIGGVTSGRFNGIISNLRILKGTALYTSNFTPSTSPLTNITNTSLLLNGTNAGIFDNAMMNNVETLGNAQINTSTKKYGTGSMAFDGSGDYLVSYNSNLYLFSTQDFTAECWIYPNSFPSEATIISTAHPTDYQGFTLNVGTSGNIIFALGSGGSWTVVANSGTGTLSTGQWQHLALTRSGNVFRIFINGTQTYTTTNSISLTNTNNLLAIGGRTVAGGQYLNGYIDDLRITKGFARYTTTFTPPTRAFPNK